MINLEQLVKELMSLGLTSQEAHIYVFFAQNNSKKKTRGYEPT